MDGVVFVETPAGSRNKYEWDEELGGLALDRRLFTSMSYPADYGYIAWMRITDIHDIPAELRNEIEHFFQVYKDLEHKKTETYGFGNRDDAVRLIAEARERVGA